MKKIISIFLIVACLVTMLVLPVTAATDSVIAIPADKLEKKFVVDGNLDIWYMNNDDAVADGDANYYHYIALSPYAKSDGTSYYSEPQTAAQVWTAWDDQYVYIYVKVWDDDVVAYDKNGIHAGRNSSACDSIEIWFDPDPNSQTHTFEYDENGNVVKEIPRPPKGTINKNDYMLESEYKQAVEDSGEIEDLFCNQTNDADQGDVQVRWMAKEDSLTDYHNIVNPNYGGVKFADWVKKPENFCTFTFQDEPIVVDETGIELTSGFGVEARFPRHNDLSNNYQLHVAVNNSGVEMWEWYALATGGAWWMSYDTAWKVGYVKNAPFFNQSEEQLAAKGVMYTDSKINKTGPAGQVVDKIAALGTVTMADKEKVLALKAEYDALTVLEKGYVEYKGGTQTLEAALQVISDGDNAAEADKQAAEAVDALIDKIQSKDPEAIDAARTAYDALTDIQKTLVTNLAKLAFWETLIYGDLDADKKTTAADALEVLKSVVGKTTLTDEQFTAADTDGNGKADAADALNILKKVVGKIEKFPIEQ